MFEKAAANGDEFASGGEHFAFFVEQFERVESGAEASGPRGKQASRSRARLDRDRFGRLVGSGHELVLEDFAERVAGQAVDEVHETWALERR